MQGKIFLASLALFAVSCAGGGGGGGENNETSETGTLNAKAVFPENRIGFNDTQTVKILIKQYIMNYGIDGTDLVDTYGELKNQDLWVLQSILDAVKDWVDRAETYLQALERLMD